MTGFVAGGTLFSTIEYKLQARKPSCLGKRGGANWLVSILEVELTRMRGCISKRSLISILNSDL